MKVDTISKKPGEIPGKHAEGLELRRSSRYPGIDLNIEFGRFGDQVVQGSK
jgi:hypothetical protein